MRTTLFLVRHGATAANLARPARLQGRGQDLPLDDIGVRQAEVTRDFLAIQSFSACYSSPLKRARQTATILGEPHELVPQDTGALTECDVGQWETLSWDDIEQQYPSEYAQYMTNPAQHGYLGGESFADVHDRVAPALEKIFDSHRGESILVVAHHVVCRVYLAGLLGLGPANARAVSLDNCSISIVERKHTTTVKTVNSALHVIGVT